MRITKEARCAKNAREYIGNRPRLVEGKIYTLIFRQQAVHNSREMRELLCKIAQTEFEKTHTRKEWEQIARKNYL